MDSIIEYTISPETDTSSLSMKHKISQEIHHKVKWTVEEDEGLKRLVQSHGPTKWNKISVNLQALFGFIRNSTQCRDRWLNHVDPELKTGPWTDHEDKLIFYGQALLGNACVEIAKYFPGRSEISVKNRWYGRANKKKLEKMSSSLPHP